MKARKVEGLDPDGPLAANAARVVRVRAGELSELAAPAFDGDSDALHDMRIAAKRLRYVLETVGSVFGEYAATAAKRAKSLQSLLGEIHDHDVMLPRVLRLVEAAGDGDTAGLQALRADLLARRAVCFGEARALWEQMGEEGFRSELETAIAAPVPG